MKTVWNRLLFTTFVASFVATLPPALSQVAVLWTPFESKELQFSMSFCGAPEAKPNVTDQKGDKRVTTTSYQRAAILTNYLCMIGISDYNYKPDVEGELLRNQTGFVETVRGTLGTSRRTDFVNASEKLPARTFMFDIPPYYTGSSVVILAGTRLYQLVWIHKKDMPYAPAMQQFFGSFRINGAIRQ